MEFIERAKALTPFCTFGREILITTREKSVERVSPSSSSSRVLDINKTQGLCSFFNIHHSLKVDSFSYISILGEVLTRNWVYQEEGLLSEQHQLGGLPSQPSVSS